MTAQELEQLQPGDCIHIITYHSGGIYPKLLRCKFVAFTPTETGFPEVEATDEKNRAINADKEDVFADYKSAGIEMDSRWGRAIQRLQEMQQHAETKRRQDRNSLKIVTGHTF